MKRQRRAAHAQRKTRQSREFLSYASHEIRTPLHGIAGYTSLLLGTQLTAEQRALADALRAGVDSLLDIVNDVLDVSALEAGGMRIEPQEFDVLALVRGVADQFSPQAWSKELDLRVECEGVTHTALVGDPGRIRQVLGNLVSNAVKFTDAGGVSIDVNVTPAGSRRRVRPGAACELRVAVSDSGPGVPRAARRRLFSPFSRIAQAGVPGKPGTGLGLAISKQLTELMGGTLTFTPRREGGSTFAFAIPVGKAASSFVRGPAALDLSGLRVYVADDDPLSRRELLEVLEKDGIVVCDSGPAATLADALLQADRTGTLPQLVLVGHVREAGADVELAARLAAHEQLARVPLVLVPVAGLRGHAQAVRDAGYAAYLPRPLRSGELKECVCAALLRSPSSPDGVGAGSNGAGRVPLLTRYRLADVKRMAAAGEILIVDDHPANLAVTRLLVERLGYAVDTATNGAEAVAAVLRGDYQVVLMDCQMPTMNGPEAAAEIRRATASSHRPAIVAVTAQTGTGWKGRYSEAGIDDVLEKPVRPQTLADTLGRYMRIPAGSPRLGDLISEVGLELTLDLARDYLRGVRQALDRLGSGDIEVTKRDAHRLLGSAGTLSLSTFERLWRRVEELASTHEGIPDAIARELEDACVELERWIEGHHEKRLA